MAATLSGAGGLFTRLGKLIYPATLIKTHQTNLDTEIVDAIDEYTGNWDYQKELAAAILPAQLAAAGVFSTFRTVAHRTLIDQIDDDDPLPSKDLYSALERLIEQMGTANDVDGNDTGISSAAGGSNTGNGEPVMSIVNTDGFELQYLRPESIILKCIKDAQVSGTASRETFSIEGEQAETNYQSPDWPGGSGISSTLRVSDPSEDAQTGVGRNILTNSDFETFTVANTPDNFSLGAGIVAGTDIFEEGSVVYRTGSSLKLLGHAGSAVEVFLTQTLDTAGQTTGYMKPETRYCLAVRLSAGAGITSGAKIRISVKDGSNNIIDSSTALISITCSTISTGGTFDLQTVKFNTPKALPSGLKLVIEITTSALNTGEAVYVDDLILFPMTQHGGPSGPYINLLPGSTNFVIDDTFTLTVTNDYAGDFQYWLDRFCDLYGLGLQIPFQTDTSETIDDNLIS